MLFNVQVLRGLAAASVIWVHAQRLVHGDWLPPALAEVGYGGVDLFFVISGFIMVHTTHGKTVTPYRFMRSRLIRILPLYYAVTLLAFAMSAVVPQYFSSTSPEICALVKSLSFIPFEKTAGRIYPTYYLGWTINFEIFFYVAFAVSLLLNERLRILAVMALMIGLVVLGRGIDTPGDQGVLAFYYTRPILLDFAMGVLIGGLSLSARRLSPAASWAMLAIGAALFVLGGAFVTFGNSAALPATDTVLRFGVPSALLVAGAVGLDKATVRMGPDVLRRLGDASYSIYLSHYFFVALAIAGIDALDLGGAARALVAPVVMVGAVTGGIITYRLLERPMAGDWSAYASLRSIGSSRLGMTRKSPSPAQD